MSQALTQCIGFALTPRKYQVPPYVLILVCLSRRLHSIYVLRLFNDPVAMFFMYAATLAFLSKRWTISSVLFRYDLENVCDPRSSSFISTFSDFLIHLYLTTFFFQLHLVLRFQSRWISSCSSQLLDFCCGKPKVSPELLYNFCSWCCFRYGKQSKLWTEEEEEWKQGEKENQCTSFLTSISAFRSLFRPIVCLDSTFVAVYPSSSWKLPPEGFRVLQSLSIQVDCELEVLGWEDVFEWGSLQVVAGGSFHRPLCICLFQVEQVKNERFAFFFFFFF